MPPVPVHRLWYGNRQRQVRALAVQRPDVVDQRRDHSAVRRDDDLEGQVVSPCLPVTEEPVGLLCEVGLMCRGERGLAECGGIRERAEGSPVQGHDRDNGERVNLGGGLGGPGLRVQRATPSLSGVTAVPICARGAIRVDSAADVVASQGAAPAVVRRHCCGEYAGR
jgi:hypothetical protein